MQKTVKQIAELVSEISSKYEVMEDTALNILAAAAGGFENIGTWIEENEDECCCDDDKEDDWDDIPAAHGWDYEEDEVLSSTEITVGTKNRVTVPRFIIEEAEKALTKRYRSSKKDGEFTVERGDAKVTVYFGDCIDEYDDDCDGVTVNHLNANGSLQFSVAPTFKTGDVISCSVLDDGRIVLD